MTDVSSVQLGPDRRLEAIRHYGKCAKEGGLDKLSIEALILTYKSFHALVEHTPKFKLEWEDGIPVFSPPNNRKFWRQMHGAMGLAGEGAEVLEIYKKRLFGKNKPIDRDKVKEELGDSLFYWVLSLDANDISLAEAIVGNILKLSERYGT